MHVAATGLHSQRDALERRIPVIISLHYAYYLLPYHYLISELFAALFAWEHFVLSPANKLQMLFNICVKILVIHAAAAEFPVQCAASRFQLFEVAIHVFDISRLAQLASFAVQMLHFCYKVLIHWPSHLLKSDY